MLNEARQVLLVRFDFPARTLWATPGGGLEAGENHDDALRRELVEELGLQLGRAAEPHVASDSAEPHVASDSAEPHVASDSAEPKLGPELWWQTRYFPHLDGTWDGQVDRVRLVEVADFSPNPQKSWDELRAEWVGALAWWTPAELMAAAIDGTYFSPRRLPALVVEVLARGVPTTPFTISEGTPPTAC